MSFRLKWDISAQSLLNRQARREGGKSSDEMVVDAAELGRVGTRSVFEKSS